MCWLGAALLLAWGGVNTVVGNLVLGGVITSTDGFDQAGMIGHAYLWDPLFLAWGIALVGGLITSRGAHVHQHRVRLEVRATRAGLPRPPHISGPPV